MVEENTIVDKPLRPGNQVFRDSIVDKISKTYKIPSVANVLIVDDDAAIRGLLKRLVLRTGNRPWDVSTAEEAMVILKGSSFSFDLIILDMVLPGRNGLDCLREMRLTGPNVPVIVISGWLTSRSRVAGEMARELGVQCFLPKPFDVTELNARITEAIASSS